MANPDGPGSAQEGEGVRHRAKIKRSEIRRRPARPYRAVRVTHMVKAINRFPFRGSRRVKCAWAVFDGLRRHQSGILYQGDDALARAAGLSHDSVERFKADCDAGLVPFRVSRTKGGRTISAEGRAVAAATGYEAADELLKPEHSAPRELSDREAAGRRALILQQIAESRALRAAAAQLEERAPP